MGWVKMKLGDILKNRDGRYKPNDPAILGLKRIDKINFSGQIFLSDKASNTDMILIKKDDLVISGINVEKGALVVYEEQEDILATIHYSSYIINIEKIDVDFLKVFLRSPDFVQLLKEQVPGGIKTEIKPKHILPLEVYFPDTTKEQKNIATHFFEKEAKLNKVNGLISRQISQIENLNKAILQEVVQGKLVQQDPKDEPASELLKRIKAEKVKSGKKEKTLPPINPEEIPFEIPENWVWSRLGEICSHISDIDHSMPKAVKSGGVKFLSAKDLLDDGTINFTKDIKYISEEDFTRLGRKIIPQRNDIIYSRIGAKLGKARIVECDEKFIVSYSCCTIRTLNPNIQFLSFLLDSGFVLKQATGQTTMNSIPDLGIQKIKEFMIPLPPLSEQKRIVAEIEKQLAKTKQLKEHITANQQATELLLKALLHQAFEAKE